MAMLLQLSLCVVTLIQLTSSQSTYDVIKDEDDVNSCGGSEQVLSQLVTAVSQVQTALTQLQRDVAELKSFNRQEPVEECPADFTYIPSVNGCYKVVSRNLDWSAAGLACRSLHKDAHLLVINNAAEQSAVAAMISRTNITQLLYWTAGQRIDPSRNSTFVWRTSNTYTTVSGMTYNNWDSGQPNWDQRQSCMHLDGGHSYRWHDYPCSSPFYSVCELDIRR